MRVAIVHNHLHPGGVTRVIENALAALADSRVRAAVLTGEPPPADDLPTGRPAVLAGLRYEEQRPPCSSDELAADLLDTARQALGQKPDVWHFHNHSLGKNLAIPGAVRRLAAQGHRVLLQIHDFAEDGRPTNYCRLTRELADDDPERLSAILYPQAEHVHYAVLNGRDRTFLAAAGVPETRLHLLPNAIWVPAQEASAETPRFPGDRLWLYPTRGIRRKNLGEFLLLAALGRQGEHYATTLAPKNPLDLPGYQRWLRLVEELRLPVSLGLADNSPASFGALVAASHALVTTSVAEGFGLAFLEPWLMGRAVRGRNLGEITGEFLDAGIDLGGLYDRLEVPADWLAPGVLATRVREGLKSYLSAYGRGSRPDDVERVISAWIHGGRLDFGRLDEALQESILRRAVASREARAQLRPRGLPDTPPPAAQLQQNRRVVLKHFGLAGYSQRLEAVYEALTRASPGPVESISGDSLLDEFLRPERLFLLRT